jgi:hypothetical protein
VRGLPELGATREQVPAWLDAYVDAWRTYEASAIGELFIADASYAYHRCAAQTASSREGCPGAGAGPEGFPLPRALTSRASVELLSPTLTKSTLA